MLLTNEIVMREEEIEIERERKAEEILSELIKKAQDASYLIGFSTTPPTPSEKPANKRKRATEEEKLARWHFQNQRDEKRRQKIQKQ